jgi:hypothetical protein
MEGAPLHLTEKRESGPAIIKLLSILKEYLIQRMVVLRISTALITFSD